jgi:hypothetical protein
MKTLLLLCSLLFVSPVYADILDFEVGGQTGQLLFFTSGGSNYGGAEWDLRWAVLDQAGYQATWGSTLAFPSGEQVLFNGFGTQALHIDAESLTVNGAWFAPWTAYDQWYDPYSAHSVTMEGWQDGLLVGSATLDLDPSAFRYLATDFGPVEQLRLIANAPSTWYLMDNFDATITPRQIIDTGGGNTGGPSGTVPEPSSLVLLAVAVSVGLVGWLSAALRRDWRASDSPGTALMRP